MDEKSTKNDLKKPVTEQEVKAASKVTPGKLKEKFENYEYIENEEIVDNVSSKVVEAIGDAEPDKVTKKSSGGPLTPFEQFLNDTNLTFRQFMMFVIFIGLLISVVVFSIYFMFSFFGSEPNEVRVTDQQPVVTQVPASGKDDNEGGFFSRLFSKKSEPPEVKVVTPPKSDPKPVDEDESEVPKTEEPKDGVVKDDDKVSVPTQIGKTVVPKFSVTGVKTATKIGSGEITENKLSYYVRTYRKIRNIYNIDLFDYLATVPDRKAGYDQFLVQFKGTLEELRLANEDLQQEIALLKLRLDQLQVQTTTLENKFFDDLDGLESETLPETLLAFQEISQKRSIVLSELKAREAILPKYIKAIPLVQEQIAAMEVNEDPFVKGVKVVDFGRVDLDLVVRDGR